MQVKKIVLLLSHYYMRKGRVRELMSKDKWSVILGGAMRMLTRLRSNDTNQRDEFFMNFIIELSILQIG